MPVFSQSPAPSPPAVQPYEGLLRETDLRLAQCRKLLIEKQPLPEFLVLRYRGTEWNHVVFYDLDGREALFQYRKDRFDDLAEKKIRDLLPGQAYRVRGTFIGLIDQRMIYPPDSERFLSLLDTKAGRLGFDFGSAEPVQPDFVIY